MSADPESCVFVGEREDAMQACMLLRENGIAARLEDLSGSPEPTSIGGRDQAQVIVPGEALEVARLVVGEEEVEAPRTVTPAPKQSRVKVSFLSDTVVALVVQWLLCGIALLIPGGLLVIGIVYAPFVWLFRAIGVGPTPEDGVDLLAEGWEVTIGAPLFGCLVYALLYALWKAERRRTPAGGAR